MTHRIVAKGTLALLVGAATGASWAQDQACVDIARIGLVDKENIRTLEDRIERIFLYARSERESTSNDVDRLSAAAQIPLGKILVGASATLSEEEYQRIRQMDERTFKRYVRDAVAKYSERETANQSVAGVVDRCLNRAGFAAWPSFGPGNYLTPALILSYVAPPELPGNASLDVNLTYPTGQISCEDKDGEAKKVRLKSRVPVTLRCTRASDDANSALVAVNPESATTILTRGDVWFPSTAKQSPICTKAIAERIELVVDKSRDWVQKIGPYCEPTSITMAAKAEAKAQPGTSGAYSSLRVYKGTDPLPDAIFINDRKDLRTSGWIGLGAGPRTTVIPAYRAEEFLLQIDDRLADTEQGLWVIDIQPK